MTKKESVIEDWLTANGNKEIELRVKREIEDYIWYAETNTQHV